MEKEQLAEGCPISLYRDHAERELGILFPEHERTALQKIEIERIVNMMETLDCIDDFELKYAAVMPYLFRQIPVTPLTGEDDEWIENVIEKDGVSFAVNKRASNVVKTKEGAFLLDARVFSDDGGKTFHRTENSYVPIESFPFQVPFVSEYIVNPTNEEIVALETEAENKSQDI
jgi:hypothetical protein